MDLNRVNSKMQVNSGSQVPTAASPTPANLVNLIFCPEFRLFWDVLWPTYYADLAKMYAAEIQAFIRETLPAVTHALGVFLFSLQHFLTVLYSILSKQQGPNNSVTIPSIILL